MNNLLSWLGDPLNMLVVLNTTMVVALFLALMLLIWKDRASRFTRDRFAPDAFHFVLIPLAVGMAAWSGEYVMKTCWRLEHKGPLTGGYLLADVVLNTITAAGEALAGWSLLRLLNRSHPRLARPRKQPRTIDLVARFVGSGVGLWVLLLAVVAALLVSLWRLLPGGGPVDALQLFYIVDSPQRYVSFLGLTVFGLGLWREMTRERSEIVSKLSSGSVIFYGFLQLTRNFGPAEHFLLVLALLLKVTFLVGILSFWAVVRASARKQEQDAVRIETLLRVPMVPADYLHHTVGNDLKAMPWILKNAVDQFSKGKADLGLEWLDDLEMNLDLATKHLQEVLASGVDGSQAAVRVRGGLKAALEGRLDEARRRGLEVGFVFEMDEEIMDERLQGTLYGIAYEAINNVERHAKAATLTVVIKMQVGVVRLEVTDDGRGYEPTAKAGIGLRSMQERARLAGGWCRVESLGHGTRVIVELPLIGGKEVRGV